MRSVMTAVVYGDLIPQISFLMDRNADETGFMTRR